MPLITDAIGLGAAFAVAVGSAIQAVQAFDQLNDETPFKNLRRELILAALGAFFTVVLPRTNVETMGPRLRRLGLGTEENANMSDQQLLADPATHDWVKSLKKWLGLFVGWFFISLGALAALAAAAWMLANDL
jgi:hypothetical protein